MGIILYFIMKKWELKDLFKKPEHHKKHEDKLIGKLMVSSEGEIHLELPEKPDDIMVMLKGEQHNVPCNSHHKDHVRWHVCNFHKHHCLIIEWNVCDTREIIWEVIF